MEAWRTEGDFRERVAEDPEVRAVLGDAEIAEVFRLERYLAPRGRASSPACSVTPPPRPDRVNPLGVHPVLLPGSRERRDPRRVVRWRALDPPWVFGRDPRAALPAERRPPVDDQLVGCFEAPRDLGAVPGGRLRRRPSPPAPGRAGRPVWTACSSCSRRSSCWPWASRGRTASSSTGTPASPALGVQTGSAARVRPALRQAGQGLHRGLSRSSSASSTSASTCLAGRVAGRGLAGHRPGRPGHPVQHVRGLHADAGPAVPRRRPHPAGHRRGGRRGGHRHARHAHPDPRRDAAGRPQQPAGEGAGGEPEPARRHLVTTRSRWGWPTAATWARRGVSWSRRPWPPPTWTRGASRWPWSRQFGDFAVNLRVLVLGARLHRPGPRCGRGPRRGLPSISPRRGSRSRYPDRARIGSREADPS